MFGYNVGHFDQTYVLRRNLRAMIPTRQVVVGTAGHIDHGKTALVRALTGVDTDRLPAEKERGITIDLGFAGFDLGGIGFSLVDVPGHERFIRNMLAGATGLDLALLVIAADDSIMPQTREHLEILQHLGLSKGLVAISKCDAVEEAWIDLVNDEARKLTLGTFLEDCPIVRTSAVAGLGIDHLQHTLVELARTLPKRHDPGLFRLSIDRSFSVHGHGTVVTGTVASGTARVGDELELLPACKRVRVRGLKTHDLPVDSAGVSTRLALNLAGIKHDEVRRGDVLAEPGFLKPSRCFSIELRVSESAPRPIKHARRYRLHLGTAEVSCTLALRKGVEAAAGEAVLAQLFLAESVAAVHGQPFVLREESPSATIGGGVVLEPLGRRLKRNDASATERLRL